MSTEGEEVVSNTPSGSSSGSSVVEHHHHAEDNLQTLRIFAGQFIEMLKAVPDNLRPNLDAFILRAIGHVHEEPHQHQHQRQRQHEHVHGPGCSHEHEHDHSEGHGHSHAHPHSHHEHEHPHQHQHQPQPQQQPKKEKEGKVSGHERRLKAQQEAAAKEEKRKEIMLKLVVHELRNSVPPNAEAPGEQIVIPKDAEFETYTASNTFHVDSFLYPTEDDVDDLVEKGLIPREYCTECGSQKTKPINYISHSASLAQLKYIFSDAVLGDLNGKVLLDVGSRLGSVLYTGHILSKAKELVGVEMNKFFADLQQNFITSKYKMADRIRIIHGDILEHTNELTRADVVVLDNVFQFFIADKEKLSHIWSTIRKNLTRKGQLIVSLPSLKSSLATAGSDIDIKKWVKEVPLRPPLDEKGEVEEDYKDIHLYTVIG
eukprot:TRINITY_DN6971_c0_g1_i1.p1 TRINITY_DN6971_c0_g1~~TRINITY_DN6971_c0_g1_i1.p1  ORF type:complete len:429 (-),score=74.30 TRINITY_DN6971_c0_g1_i1:139-1425(-)